MKRLQMILILLVVAGFAFLKAHAAPVARSAAVWPDAVAVVVGGKLAVLDTGSDRILWTYDFEGRPFHGLVKVGRRIFVGDGGYVEVFDRDRIETKPRTWRRTPPTRGSAGLWELYERAVPLVTDGRYVWGRFDNPSHRLLHRPGGAIFAVSVGNVDQWPSLAWSGGIVCGDALAVQNDYLVAGHLGFFVYDATNGTWLNGVGPIDLWGDLVFAVAGNTIVASTTRISDIYGYSLTDVAESSREPDPRWKWASDNEPTDIMASPDGKTVFVSQATIMPYSTGHGGQHTSPTSSLTALNSSTGKPRWTRVLVSGDERGMYLPIRDVTLHQGVLLAVTKRLGPGEAGELDDYLADVDVDDFRYLLFCLDAETGAIKWNYRTQGVEGIVAAVGSTVYLETDRDLLGRIKEWAENSARRGRPRSNLPDWSLKLQAFDLSAGRLLWTAEEAQVLAATETLAYVRLGDGSVVAVESATGETRYEYVFGEEY